MEQTVPETLRLKYRPIVLLTLSIAVGILFGQYASMSLLWFFLAGSFACASTGLAKRHLPLVHCGIFALAAALGMLRIQSVWNIPEDDVSRFPSGRVVLSGVVASEPLVSGGESSSRSYSQLRFLLRASRVVAEEDSNEVGVSGFAEVYGARIASSDRMPGFGDTVQVVGMLSPTEHSSNPFQRDKRNLLTISGAFSTITATKLLLISEAGTYGTARPIHPLTSLRKWMIKALAENLPRQQFETAAAIALGASENLSGSLRTRFSDSGAAHLISTAGFHIGVIVALLLYALPLMGLTRQASLVSTLICIISYAAITGARPAVVRASIVAGVYLVGKLLNRQPDAANAIAIAAASLLLANPLFLFDSGFQISFATAITLLLTIRHAKKNQSYLYAKSKRWPRKIRTISSDIVGSLVISLGAQLGCFPLIASYFNYVSAAGLLVNLVALPLAVPVIVLSFCACAVSAISSILAAPLFLLLKLFTGLLLVVVKEGGTYGGWKVGSPEPVAVVIYYCVLWAMLWRSGKRGARLPVVDPNNVNQDTRHATGD